MCDKLHYDALEERVTKLEDEVKELRNETSHGFRSLTEKFDGVIATVVAEKVKWGDVVRSIVIWASRVILLGAATAMGVTAYKMIFPAG